VLPLQTEDLLESAYKLVSGTFPLNFHATKPLTHRTTSGFTGCGDDARPMRSFSLCTCFTLLSQRPQSESGSGRSGQRTVKRSRFCVSDAMSIRDRMSLSTYSTLVWAENRAQEKKTLPLPIQPMTFELFAYRVHTCFSWLVVEAG
jgi:hypothetical protein